MIVEPNSAGGIRPAGPPDSCFYCGAKVGDEHGAECVVPKRRVRVRFSFEVEWAVPESWDKDMIEFHMNESSWCADNAAHYLVNECTYTGEGESRCLCRSFEGEYLGEVPA